MRDFIIFLYVLVVLTAGVFAVFIKARDRSVGRKIRACVIVGGVATLFFAIAYFASGEVTALLMYTLFLILVEWEIFLLLLFVCDFTRIIHIPAPAFWGMVGLNGISIIFHAINVFTGNLFDMVQFPVFGGVFYMGAPKSPLFFYRVGICALYSIGSVVALIAKAVKSPNFYKKKFITIAAILVIQPVLDNFINLTQNITFLSGVLYGLEPVFIGYYLLVYGKSRIVGDMLAVTVDDMPTAMLCFDNDGNCVYYNRFASEIFKLGDDNPYGLMEYLSGRFPGLDYEHTENGSRTDNFEIRGDNHYFESSYKKIFDKKGNFVGFYLIFSDRTKNITDLKTEQYKASHDNLTAIYNSAGFEAKVKQLLQEEPDVDRVIVCSNIKDFKMINDLFGSKVADGVLVNIARQLIKNCSGTDSIPARLDNDRFALCMRKERYNDELFNEVAQKAVRVPGNEYYKVFCYIGVYEITDKSIPVADMCEKAMLAMEQIKGNYNIRVAHYNAEISDKLKKEQEIVAELKHAIENKEFTFYIQPIVDKDGYGEGGEALARWVRPKKGVVPPAAFIPVFERTGFITVLDKYIWEKACEVLRQWQNIGITDKYLSVNISPRDFFYVDVYNTLTLLVQKYGISPQNLKLEITESAIMADLENRVSLIKKFKEFGFTVAMDDYGKEHYSMGALKDIPVDAIKFDMKCLKESESDSKSKEILKSLLDLAKQLDFKTITMGVETEEQVNFLVEMGGDLFQGYYFAKPMSVDDFEQEYMGLGSEDGEEFSDLIKNATAGLEEEEDRKEAAEAAELREAEEMARIMAGETGEEAEAQAEDAGAEEAEKPAEAEEPAAEATDEAADADVAAEAGADADAATEATEEEAAEPAAEEVAEGEKKE
ncbi:MAG: EAL domain-containing protein [Lachnospiraceae bacterium]|nr:EAL domain-containing protein [Lachnospiraceae bacterium]